MKRAVTEAEAEATVFDPKSGAGCLAVGVEGRPALPQRRGASIKTSGLTEVNTGWPGMV